MKTLLIDDNQNIREGLKDLLLSFCANKIEKLYEAHSLKTGLLAIKKHEPELVFLDVELGDGTGMELLSLVEKINFHVIFVTAHDKYALDAFRFSAVDFLLKPIDVEQLIESVEKVQKRVEEKQVRMQYQILLDNFNPTHQDKKIVLKTSEAIYFIKVKDIVRCEASGAYTVFVIQGEQNLLISKNLKEFDTLLSKYGFIRTHQSHLINIQKIIRIDKVDGGAVIMDNKDVVPISHRKREIVMEILQNL